MDYVALSAAEKRKRITDEIFRVLNLLCTGNSETCHLGMCKFNGECQKKWFEDNGVRHKNVRLKSLLKNIKKHDRKRLGRESPSHLGTNIHEIASTLVGCDIYEHDLVKGSKWATKEISRCTTLNQIAGILDRRNIQVTGKSKLWTYKQY